MKSRLIFLIVAVLCASAHAAEPPVTFTVEPLEGGQLIYAPMGRETASDPATGRLWFKAKIQNNGNSTLTLLGFQVLLTGVDQSIPAVASCPVGETTVALRHTDVVTIPHPAAATVTIRLYFIGNPTPKETQFPLTPYVPAVVGGQFLYPADEGDIGPNEYFSDSQAHTVEESQAWGADWKVYRVDAAGTSSTADSAVIRAGGSYEVNEDHLGWGVPIRAIADGFVLRTSTGWENNPTAGTRAFQKMAQFEGAAIADVKVTKLTTTRAATLVRLTSGQVILYIWDILDTGRTITLRGGTDLVSGELVTDMAIDELSSTRVAGVLRLTNGMQRVVLWNVDDPTAPERHAEHDDTSISEGLSLAGMTATASRFAVAARTPAGALQVRLYEERLDANDDPIIILVSIGDAGTCSSVCVTALSTTRLATSLRNQSGALQVIVWDYSSGFFLQRRGDDTAGAITRVAASIATKDSWTRNRWVTAARTSSGEVIQLIRWDASDDGMTLTRDLETVTTQAIENTALALASGTGKDGADNVTSAAVLADGSFKINGWGDPDVAGTYAASAQNSASSVDRVSLDELGATEYLAAVRTTGGNLRLMTWHWAGGGGNSVIVLHGNCRVLYAHLQDGSVDTSVLYPKAPVLAGQVLGRMGNSGASGAPHTHINSDRVEDGRTLDELVAADLAYSQSRNAGDLPITGPRPMPFSGARAMRLSLIHPGGESNPANAFSTLNNQGMYDIPLGIRPRLNTRYVDPTIIYAAPNGRKEPRPGNPVTGGPYPIPSFAVGAVPSGGTLYIRGRSYDEAITFSTPMTVRRYDFYPTGGPVVIGK